MNDKSMLLSKKPMVIIGIVVSIIIIIGGYIYYTSEKDSFREEKSNELSAISNLKINQILKWRKERIADVKVTTQSEFFEKAVAQWLSNRDILILKKEIEDRLKLTRTEFGYKEICITDTKGEFILSIDGKSDIDSIMKKEVIKSVEKKEIIFSDFYKCPFDGEVHLTITAPLNNDNEIKAAIVFIIDPYEYIFPLIQSWPTPSETAETLILKKDGDSVIFINELRHRNNTALDLSVPLTEEEIPAVQAVLGYEGIFEGKDYRGIDVLSDVSKISDTQWYMIAKIDQSEVYSRLRYRTGVIIGFVSLLIFLLSVGLAFIYNNRQSDTFKDLYIKEKELSDKQEEFRTTLYNIGDGVITTNKNGFVTHVNRVAETLIGMCETVAMGKQLEEVFNVVDEDTRLELENPVQKILRELSVVGLSNHTLLLSKNGLEIPISTNGAPILNEDNEITGVVLAFRDQFKERKARKELIESEAKLSNALEIAHLGHWEYDVANDLFTFNDQFYKIFKTTAEQVGGYTMHSADYANRFVHPDDMHLVGVETRQAIETKDPDFNRQIEHRILYSDGTIGYITVRFFIMKDDKGNTIKTYGVNQDITQRKFREEALRNSEEKYRGVVDNIAIGVALINPDMEILTLNRQMREWFPNADVSKRPICYEAFNVPPRDEICSYCPTCKTIEDGLVHEAITETPTKDGIINFRIISSPIKDNNGKVIAAIEMVEDVSERKRWEKEILNAKEQLQNLSVHLQTIREEERGVISREIHDDLGQSLTALKMDMSWFRKHLHKDDGSSEKKINGMIELVNETIKSVQRISTELRPAVLDDLGFSSAVKWFMSEFEERTELKCQLEIKPDEIVLDEKLSIAMYRIFQESLTNVARHAKATEVKVNIKLIKNKLSLVVEDNGVGIDEERLKDPKSIGLIGMQERVYPWHGTVEITGEKGKGTVVKVNVKL